MARGRYQTLYYGLLWEIFLFKVLTRIGKNGSWKTQNEVDKIHEVGKHGKLFFIFDRYVSNFIQSASKSFGLFFFSFHVWSFQSICSFQVQSIELYVFSNNVFRLQICGIWYTCSGAFRKLFKGLGFSSDSTSYASSRKIALRDVYWP